MRASEVQHRYVVIGVGAIGGCIGGVLARAGVPVVLVARGRTTEVLVAENSTLHTPDGEVVARATRTVEPPMDIAAIRPLLLSSDVDVATLTAGPTEPSREANESWQVLLDVWNSGRIVGR